MSVTVCTPRSGHLACIITLISLFFLNPAAVQAQDAGPTGPAYTGREISALAPEIDLALREGDIMVGSRTIHITEYAESVERLARLLVLKAKPSMLDDPRWTMFFARTFTSREVGRYGDVKPYGQWRGANQFQREDSRKAFLAKFRDKLLGMRPALPLTIADMRDVSIFNYDDATQKLRIEISEHSAWPPFGEIRFETPLPFRLPKEWAMPPDEARRIIETAAANTRTIGMLPTATALLRYTLREVRGGDGGVVLDFAALDITIYANRDLETVIGHIPLPPDAIVDTDAAGAAQAVPYLDPDYASIAAAALHPELLGQEAFLREAYRLRRMSEERFRRNYMFNRFPAVLSWPTIVPAALIGSNAAPDAADLTKLRDWLKANAAQLGDTVRLPGICSYPNARAGALGNCKITTRKESDPSKIDLAAYASFGGGNVFSYDWDYARVPHTHAKALVEDAKRIAPDAIAVHPLPSGAQIPAVVALAPHPAWFGVGIEGDPEWLASATLDLTVTDKAIHQDRQGKPFLMISVVPKALTYTPAGGAAATALDLSQQPAPAAAAALDVLGVRIGMTLADAEAALKQHLTIEHFQRTEGRLLPDGLTETYISFENSAQPDRSIRERINLFVDDQSPDRTVIAVFRSVKGSPEVRNAAEAALISKYGPPDATVNSINKLYFWGVDPVTQARFRAGISYDDACGLNGMGILEAPSDNQRFILDLFKRRCGTVLSASLREDEAIVILTDSNRAMDLADIRRAAQTEAQAERQRAVPGIKF